MLFWIRLNCLFLTNQGDKCNLWNIQETAFFDACGYIAACGEKGSMEGFQVV